jgi:hypothetical protein
MERLAVTKINQSPKTVERRIQFFRADAGATNGIPNDLDLTSSIEAVANLPFKEGSKRYWMQDNGDAIAVWMPEGTNAGLDRFAFAGVRRNALPRAELNGTLSALPLTVGQGLHEATHVRFFSNNIVGVEFNFYAPRVTRIPSYFNNALSAVPEFSLEPLIRQDMLELLRKQQELRMLSLQVRRSYVDTVAKADKSLGKALKALTQASSAEIVGLVLRPDAYGKSPLSKDIFTFAKKLAKRDDLRPNSTQFVVRGVNSESGRVDVVDLLQDQLVGKRSVLTVGNRSRAVKSTSAYEAIESAYSELKDELESAAGISLVESV